MRPDDAETEGAIKNGDGVVARKAPHALCHRVEPTDPPGLCRGPVSQRMPVCTKARSVGERKGNPTAVGTPQSGRLAWQPHLRQPLLRNPESEALGGSRARSKPTDSEGPHDMSGCARGRVHTATSAGHDLRMDRSGDRSRGNTQRKQLRSSQAERGAYGEGGQGIHASTVTTGSQACRVINDVGVRPGRHAPCDGVVFAIHARRAITLSY